MAQTLYAFLALFLAMMFSLHQLRRSVISNEATIHSELEIMANAVGLQQVEVLAGVNYDDLFLFDGDTLSLSYIAAGDTFIFTLAIETHHATETGQYSAVATGFKEAVVSVLHQRYSDPLVRHTRIFSQ